MLKINKTKTIIFTLIGSIAALLALLIFVILPTSELANGIQYSSKTAIWVLAISPLASAISAAGFMGAIGKDFKAWNDFLSFKNLVTGLTALFAVISITEFATYLKYFLSQLSLGFVAPYAGTVYEYLAIAVTVIVVFKFIFTALTVIALKRN